MIDRRVVGLLLGMAVAAHADDARRMRRLLAAGYWPAEMKLSLGPAGTAEAPDALGKSRGTGNARRAGAPAAVAPADAAALARTATRTRAAIEKLEREIAENRKLALELDRAGMDFAKMTAGKRKRARASLRPLLLYLVEQSVIAEDEIETFLDAEDPAELIARLYLRTGSLGARRTLLEMERLFLVEQLPGKN